MVPTHTDEGDKPRMEVPAEAAEEIAAAKGAVFSMSDKPYW